MRDATDPALKGLLDRYVDALLAGRSPSEAYEEVLAPQVERLEAALKTHVASFAKR